MQLCLFSRFACFHMFKTYGCFFIYVPVSPLRLFVPLYRHILKSLLISFITFPGSRRTFEAPPLQILPQEFPPRLSLSPSEYLPRAEPLRSFTETFLSLHQENLLRFSRSTLRSGVLSLFTYILAPSVYFVNSFFEDFIFYLYIIPRLKSVNIKFCAFTHHLLRNIKTRKRDVFDVPLLLYFSCY